MVLCDTDRNAEHSNRDVGATTTTTILTLGEGDFTFTLDLVRWLQIDPKPRLQLLDDGHCHHHRVHVIATGIDTVEELSLKYKDAESVLKRLLQMQNASLNSSSNNKFNDSNTRSNGLLDSKNNCLSSGISNKKQSLLSVSVFHGVNALDIADTGNDWARQRLAVHGADIVIFNHPHLGKEDAQLHGQFLCHLFHAVDQKWLMKNSNTDEEEKQAPIPMPTMATDSCPNTTTTTAPNRKGVNVSEWAGMFLLTLVEGQYERWRCEDAARRHGMKLLDRSIFVPPHIVNHYHHHPSCYYELRRHQSGKSFKTRRFTGRSEIFTYVRDAESHLPFHPWLGANNHVRPFWTDDDDQSSSLKPTTDAVMFSCQFCDKSFREKRSLRNHIQAKHSCSSSIHHQCEMNHETLKRKRQQEKDGSVDVEAFSCPHCLKMTGTDRKFQSREALQDHIRAKHLGLHTTIPSDWAAKSRRTHHHDHDSPLGSDSTTADNKRCCEICGCDFHTEAEMQDHLRMFLPVASLNCTNTSINDSRSENGNHKGMTVFGCQFCGKHFRERRAQLQHENSCSLPTGSRKETNPLQRDSLPTC